MNRLLRRDDYRAVFDALLDIPGLWYDGLRLGITKFVLDLKCDEVSCSSKALRSRLTMIDRRCSITSTISGGFGPICCETISGP